MQHWCALRHCFVPRTSSLALSFTCHASLRQGEREATLRNRDAALVDAREQLVRAAAAVLLFARCRSLLRVSVVTWHIPR